MAELPVKEYESLVPSGQVSVTVPPFGVGSLDATVIVPVSATQAGMEGLSSLIPMVGVLSAIRNEKVA
ncbi:MAG: hypothetical protein D6794_04860, partial [Deltaproteobacteria bacterium]